jgi:hypothetical protein
MRRRIPSALASGRVSGYHVEVVTTTPDQSDQDRDQNQRDQRDERHDVGIPLRKLVELTLTHPEIGPPLADLAFAIGHTDIAEQLVRMGTDRDKPQLEYFFVAAYAARRHKQLAESLKLSLEAVRAYAAAPAGTYSADDDQRLLSLLRVAFSVLMFDLKDVHAAPEFTGQLAAMLAPLEDRLGEQSLYRVILAQALWFTNRDASEREWERARELPEPEQTFNARGTWYKEAERDLDKAERAYRLGLEKAPTQALLLHNVAQILVERAANAPSPAAARHLLHQAEDLLRRALRDESTRLRRHIHATRDRAEEIRRSLPPPPPRQQPPERQQQPDRQQPDRQQPDRQQHQQPQQPQHQQAQQPRAQEQRQGQPQRPRRDDRRDDRRNDRRDDRPPPIKQESFLTKGTVSLGDMLRAKLKEKGE